MIPKKIHYCWFGGNPLPKKAKKCINSWKKYFPDYEIIEWNESNFDINYNAYTKEAYDHKKYAFLTDVARLVVIYNEGGIYFDIDVEVIKEYDILENCEAFFGFENDKNIATGLGFGAVKNNSLIKSLLDDYNNKHFVLENGKLDLTPCPIINTKVFINNGFKVTGEYEFLNGIKLFPKEYFNPYDDSIGKLTKTNNTYSIHWFGKSWVPKYVIIRSYITKPFHKIFGKNCFSWLKKILKRNRG